MKEKRIEWGDICRLLKKTTIKNVQQFMWIKKYHLQYWQPLNKKWKFEIVPQNVSRSSPIHNHRGLYLFQMNNYSN